MALNASTSSATGDTLRLPTSILPFVSQESVSWFYTTVAILASLLVLEQAVYRYKKGNLPGDRWTIPLIGKFVDSMSPSMENYQKQWASGALSALSVFNMFAQLQSFYPQIMLTSIPASLSCHLRPNTRARSSTLPHTQSLVSSTRQRPFSTLETGIVGFHDTCGDG